MKRVAWRALAGMVLLAASMAAGAAATAQRIRINDTPGVGNLLARVAARHGFCERRGLQCELKVVPNAPLALQAMAAGDLDAVGAPADVVLQAVAHRMPLTVIGAASREPLFFLVAGSDLEVAAGAPYAEVMRRLKGRRVGVVALGTGGHFALESMLSAAAVSPSEVSIVPVGGTATALPALVRRQVDAVMGLEPMGAACALRGLCRVLVDPRRGQGPREVTGVSGAAVPMVVPRAMAQQKPETVRALVAAMEDAGRFASAPENRAALLAAIREGFDAAVPGLEALVDRTRDGLPPVFRFDLDPAALQYAADVLHRTGRLAERVDVRPLLFVP